MNIHMCDVGNGLNLYLNHSMMVDYGGEKNLLLNKQLCYHCYPLEEIEIFVLSHFHEDHYNGLFLQNTKSPFWNLHQVYYQGIPELIDCQGNNLSNQFFAYLMAVNHYLLGDKHGLASVDLIDRLTQLNTNSSFRYAPLFKGDNFHHDGITYEVLWPPRKIKCDETIVKIKKAIKAFDKAKLSNPELAELAEQYNDWAQRYTDEKNEKDATYPNDYMKYKEAINQDSFEENFSENILNDEINEANKALREAANDLNLAFKSSNELLFLGDLETNQINTVCGKLSGQHFDIFISPHHGTHFGKEMGNMKAKIVFSSVGGGNLYSGYLKNNHLRSISTYLYCTHENGCLFTSNRNGRIQIWSHKII